MLESNRITSKSFQNEEVPQFDRVNVLFGINGSGKTALAKFIIDHSGNPCFFNTDFVENNILLEDNKNIVSGVKLKIGQQASDELKIQQMSKQIASINQEKDKQGRDLKQEKENLFEILDNELKRTKRAFKTEKIHQKSNANDDPVSALDKWINEADMNSKKEFNNISELDGSIAEIDQKIYLYKSYIDNVKNVNFKELKQELERKVIKPDSEISQVIISWLRQGLKIHNLTDMNKEKERCLFCGNEFDSKKLFKRLELLIKSDYSAFIDELNLKKEKIQSVNTALDNIGSKQLVFIDTKNILDELMSYLNKKMARTEQEIELPISLTEKFNKNYKKVKKLLVNSINKRDELQKIKQRTEEYAKSEIGQQLRKNSLCIDLKKNIFKLQSQIGIQKSKIIELKKEISDIKSKQSDLNGFRDICNCEFKSIGLRLKLEIDVENKGYLVKEINGLPLRVSDLSEGERRILAFMVFFYQMRSNESEIKENIDNIVIDDPITSLDMENSYEIVEMINDLIKKISNESSHKLFVFTNSSRAFHDIGYFDVQQNKVKKWNVFKDLDGHSHVKRLDIQEGLNRSDYYKQIFKEIAQFAFENKRELENSNNAVFYCNKTRILLESHAYANYEINDATSNRNNFGQLIDDYNIPNEMKNDFQTDLDIINKNSHGFSNIDQALLDDSSSNSRIQKAIRDVIAILYCKDSKHVYCMIQSVLKEKGGRKQQLQDWAKRWKE